MSVSTRAAVCGSGEERKECRADLPTEKMARRRKRVDVCMLTLGSGGMTSTSPGTGVNFHYAHFRAVHGRLRHHDAGSAIVRGPKAGPQAGCHRAPLVPNPRRRRGCGRVKETRGEERHQTGISAGSLLPHRRVVEAFIPHGTTNFAI
jgi:hypothetical protein